MSKPSREHLFRIGYDNVQGYLHQGMASWENAALPLETVGIWTVKTLDEHKEDKDLQILDVRSGGEWKGGHVPNAEHIYVAHLEENLGKLDKSKTIATYCGSGYRASIAASILKQNGFEKVINIPGSWNAWTEAKLPVEETMKATAKKQLNFYKKQQTRVRMNRYTMLEATMDNFLLDAIADAAGAEIAFSNGWRYTVHLFRKVKSRSTICGTLSRPTRRCRSSK